MGKKWARVQKGRWRHGPNGRSTENPLDGPSKVAQLWLQARPGHTPREKERRADASSGLQSNF